MEEELHADWSDYKHRQDLIPDRRGLESFASFLHLLFNVCSIKERGDDGLKILAKWLLATAKDPEAMYEEMLNTIAERAQSLTTWVTGNHAMTDNMKQWHADLISLSSESNVDIRSLVTDWIMIDRKSETEATEPSLCSSQRRVIPYSAGVRYACAFEKGKCPCSAWDRSPQNGP